MAAIPQHLIPVQSLAEALQNLRRDIAGQLPADVHERLTTAIEDLVRLQPAGRVLQVGQKAPEFALPELGGRTVALSQQLRAGPVVLTFYRGSWCPYCDLTLRAYSKMIPELNTVGARLVAISPQSEDVALPNAVEHRALGFPVLSDVGNRVAREYGLVYSVGELMRSVLTGFGLDLSLVNGTGGWELPVPATFVVAADARIHWVSVEADYRLRAEPEQILGALRQLKRN